MAACVIVLSPLIFRFRIAVGNERMAVGKVSKKPANFRRKWMLPAIACPVTPPDLSPQASRTDGERMEHGKHRSRPYPGAQHNHRFVVRGQGEVASGRAHL